MSIYAKLSIDKYHYFRFALVKLNATLIVWMKLVL